MGQLGWALIQYKRENNYGFLFLNPASPKRLPGNLSHHLCLSQRKGPLLSTISLQSCIYGTHKGGALSQ